MPEGQRGLAYLNIYTIRKKNLVQKKKK